MGTKDRILDKAVELFNEKGTKAVSTNHIAAAVGISPGNLYYHFRNKEEIIREIVSRLDERGMEEYVKLLEDYRPGTAGAMTASFEMIQRLNWEYRFLKRELTALIINDPLLKQQVSSAPIDMKMIARAAIDASVESGLLRDVPEDVRGFLSDQICMVNLFWVNYIDFWGEEINEENIKRGSAIMVNIFKPYMTRKGLAESKKADG